MRSDKVWNSKTETVEFIREKCLEKDFQLIEVYFAIDKNHGRNQTRISFICNKHKNKGIQDAVWSSIKNAKCCRFCATDKLAKDKTKNTDEVIQAFYDNGLIPLFSPEEYRRNSQKLPCTCKLHLDEGTLHISYANVKNNQTPCSQCEADKMRIAFAKTHEQYVQEVKAIWGDEFEIMGTYFNAYTPIRTKHTLCGYEYDGHPPSLLNGHGCARCAGRLSKTTEEFKQEVFDKYGDEFIILGEYTNSNTKIKMQHNIPECDHIWEVVPSSILYSGCGCPECNISHGERKVKKYLRDNNIKFSREFTFPDCKNVFSLEFDFAIFDEDNRLLFLIEYDGELHYKVARWSKNKDKMEKKLKDVQYRDSLKNKYCQDKNIPLLRIPYWDFDNIEQILTDYLITNNIITQ